MTTPEPTTFLLLRHGETTANLQGLLQGWLDAPLDDNGRLQSQCAAEYLKDLHIDLAFSSDLSRAMETAAIALKHHPELAITPVQALREWHLGVFEGKSQAAIAAVQPEVLRIFIREIDDPHFPDGETREQFQARVNAFMHETAVANPGKTILVCTHGGVFQRILKMVVGDYAANNRLPLPTNASVSSVQYLPEFDGWKLLEWNIHHYLSHLKIHNTLVL